jgi:hypothetical protein
MAKEPADVRPELTALVDSLGGKYEWKVVANYPAKYIEEFALSARGVNVIGSPVLGGKGALLGVCFAVPVNVRLGAPVLLRREGGVDRLGKALRINREFQCGDPAFDHAVYIESDASDETVAQLLRGGAVRTRVVTLVTGIAKDVVIGDPKPVEREQRSVHVSILASHFKQRDAVVACIDTLVELGAALNASVGHIDESRDASRSSKQARGYASFGFGVLAWVAVIFLPSPPTVGWRAYEVGLGLGAIAWIACVVTFVALFRGRSTSLRTVILLSIWALGLVPTGGRVGEILNASFDRGPRVTTKTTASMSRPSKGSPRPLVHLPWLGATVAVHDDMAEGLRLSSASSPVNVVLGTGALGSPWVAALQTVPR